MVKHSDQAVCVVEQQIRPFVPNEAVGKTYSEDFPDSANDYTGLFPVLVHPLPQAVEQDAYERKLSIVGFVPVGISRELH